MKRLVSIIELPKEEWLRYRKQGICGSDAGAIAGMNPYVSAFSVYQDKITEEVIENPDNEAMKQGRDLEEYVARRFCRETGKKVKRANYIFQNEKYPWMIADFDRLIVGEKAGLECKTVSPYSEDKWKDGNVPLSYLMQVQHYLAVSGYNCWYIAALIYGRDFIIRKIERDEDLIASLVKIEEYFWFERIKKKNPPEPDGSSDYTEMLQGLFEPDKEKKVSLFGMEEKLNRRTELDTLIEKMTKEKTAIDQEIKLQMGDAVYGVVSNYKVSWTETVSNRLDTAKLKEERPDIYKDYLKRSTGRRFQVKYAPVA